MEAKTLQEVEAGYIKVSKEHADALHIMCAYRLLGTDHPRLQSYSDDNEAGGGRVLLQMLTHSEITHRAVFVIRYYGNKHLGPSRFQTIETAAKSAITRSAMNTILNKPQMVQEQCQMLSHNTLCDKIKHTAPRGGHSIRGSYAAVTQTPRYPPPSLLASGVFSSKDWSAETPNDADTVSQCATSL